MRSPRWRLILLAATLVAVPVLGWLIDRSWSTAGATPPVGIGSVSQAPATSVLADRPHSSLADGAAAEPAASHEQARQWTDRLLARVGKPAADPDFYSELFQTEGAALDALAELLVDPEPLRRLRSGDLLAGTAPDAVGNRSLALTLIEAAAIHPRAPAAVRGRAMEALVQVVSRPWELPPSADGRQVDLWERGTALAVLIRRDPSRALDSVRSLGDPAQRLLIQSEAMSGLVRAGLSQHEARRLVRRLTEES